MSTFQTDIPGFTLRFAKRTDVPQILKYIKGLAAYESELDQVTATEDVLAYALFEQNAAEVILGEYNGKPVGFACFHHSFSTYLAKPGLHLVDLFIDPPMRNKGFGKAMLSRLARLTVERGFGRLEWWVHNWNESAARLYKKWGAYPMDNIQVYRLGDEALKSL